MTYKLSRMQTTTLDFVRGFGELGATIYDLQTAMGLSKVTIYRHLEKLVEVKLVRKQYKLGDKKGYFIAGDAAAMHIMPPMGEITPAIPVATFLAHWEKAARIENWSYWDKHFKKFPFLVSCIAQFAWRFKSDEANYIPDKEEIEEVRLALTYIEQRANHLALMCNTLLHNESLWDKKKAYMCWYGDASVPFSPERAKEIHNYIQQIMTAPIPKKEEPNPVTEAK